MAFFNLSFKFPDIYTYIYPLIYLLKWYIFPQCLDGLRLKRNNRSPLPQPFTGNPYPYDLQHTTVTSACTIKSAPPSLNIFSSYSRFLVSSYYNHPSSLLLPNLRTRTGILFAYLPTVFFFRYFVSITIFPKKMDAG